MSDEARAREHLAVLAARPRPAGGAAEAAARAYCGRALRQAAFEVREEPFEYSAFPGRHGTPACGLASTILLVGAAVEAARGRAGAALAILVLGGLLIAAAAIWLGRVAVVRAPLLRRRGVNLVATRGASEPTVWLVAHLDSKSQPVPMLVRAAAIALHGATWVIAVVLSAADWLGGSFAGLWPSVGAVGAGSGLPIVASVVGAGSDGAVDNASGVAAVLLAAAALPREQRVGVLITSAEELGLAGARAWVATRQPGTALNCDGVDDDGELLCMFTGQRPARLAAAFERAAASAGRAVRVRRLLPGILVDGVAFADAGWEVLTLSRGTVGTLARIHTRSDTLELLSGSGVDDAVPILASVARELS